MNDDDKHHHEQDRSDGIDGRLGLHDKCADDHHVHRDTWELLASVATITVVGTDILPVLVAK